jgi:hypothetical protein
MSVHELLLLVKLWKVTQKPAVQVVHSSEKFAAEVLIYLPGGGNNEL